MKRLEEFLITFQKEGDYIRLQGVILEFTRPARGLYIRIIEIQARTQTTIGRYYFWAVTDAGLRPKQRWYDRKPECLWVRAYRDEVTYKCRSLLRF